MTTKELYAVLTVLLMTVAIWIGVKHDEWLKVIVFVIYVHAMYSVLTSAF